MHCEVLSLTSAPGWTVKEIPDNDTWLCGIEGATNTLRRWLQKASVFPVSVPRLIGRHIKEGDNACKKKVATDRKSKKIMAGAISLMMWQKGKKSIHYHSLHVWSTGFFSSAVFSNSYTKHVSKAWWIRNVHFRSKIKQLRMCGTVVKMFPASLQICWCWDMSPGQATTQPSGLLLFRYELVNNWVPGEIWGW